MSNTPDDPSAIFMPFAKLSESPAAGFLEHLKDKYWLIHPERGLLFWYVGPLKNRGSSDYMSGSARPICNEREDIVKSLQRSWPWAEIRLIPSVFRSIVISEFI